MSEQKRPDLPDFEHPPVIEVALSVQFEALENLRIAHLGLLWPKFRDRYPVIQEHAPIVNLVERFDQKPSPPQQIGVTLSEQPDARVWFLNKEGSHLVQVQRNRFARNWRGLGQDYPRYERLRASFQEDYANFEEFLVGEQLGTLSLMQAEVTYVNHIFAGNVWSGHGDAHKVFEICALPQGAESLAEDFGFAARYVIPDIEGDPAGRLHVTVRSAYRAKDQRPLFVMQLTARGKSKVDGLEGILSFMNLGREWIVNRFAALTTRQMHEVWGRRDAV